MIIQTEVKSIVSELKAIFDFKTKEFQIYLDYEDDRTLQLIWAVESAIKYGLERVVIIN